MPHLEDSESLVDYSRVAKLGPSTSMLWKFPVSLSTCNYVRSLAFTFLSIGMRNLLQMS